MTEDLIKRLREYEVHIEKQAKRIAELEVALKNDNLAYRQGLHDGLDERDELCAEIRKLQDASRMWDFEQMKLRNRAEKDEADLAAARAALVRWTATAVPGCSDWDIIAAARDEQPSPEKSCETCARLIREEGACGLYGVSLCSGFDKWQPKSDVCPTCHDTRRITDDSGDDWDYCPDCTGKKEAK